MKRIKEKKDSYARDMEETSSFRGIIRKPTRHISGFSSSSNRRKQEEEEEELELELPEVKSDPSPDRQKKKEIK